ncbi:MAG: ABC transporter permease subunit [Bacteroidota bacterium]|nr:ABC transporter permease subunit [Bacteroidota bacterium]
MSIPALVEDTLRSRAKAITVLLGIAAFFLLLATIVALVTDVPSAFTANVTVPTDRTVPSGASPIEFLVGMVYGGLAALTQFVAILVSVFITAGILPSTMERGTVELYLSKPLSRARLLTGRFVGCLAIVALTTGFFAIGMWTIIGLETGVWNPAFLSVILTATLCFAVLYTMMMVLGIATRSAASTIIVVFLFVYILAPILRNRQGWLFAISENRLYRSVMDLLYYIFPKPEEIAATANALIGGQSVSWMPVWSSVLFGAAMFAFAVFLFERKDL